VPHVGMSGCRDETWDVIGTCITFLQFESSLICGTSRCDEPGFIAGPGSQFARRVNRHCGSGNRSAARIAATPIQSRGESTSHSRFVPKHLPTVGISTHRILITSRTEAIECRDHCREVYLSCNNLTSTIYDRYYN
jgi:hypothetical protein